MERAQRLEHVAPCRAQAVVDLQCPGHDPGPNLKCTELVLGHEVGHRANGRRYVASLQSLVEAKEEQVNAIEDVRGAEDDG